MCQNIDSLWSLITLTEDFSGNLFGRAPAGISRESALGALSNAPYMRFNSVEDN
jgi:hypothetical protein